MESGVELDGNASFQSVVQERAIEDKFDLHTKTERQIEGSSVAEWKDQPVLCG
jgi:hypothetical protein